MEAWSMFMLRVSAGEWPSFRFFEEDISVSGDPGDDPEAAALCMNFIVKSLDETPFGVSGAMLGSDVMDEEQRELGQSTEAGGLHDVFQRYASPDFLTLVDFVAGDMLGNGKES